MDPILEIAGKHGLKVVEDCTAPGAKYKGRYAGTMGDLGCFSISCYKIIGGGEGGLLLSRDRRMFERACQVVEKRRVVPARSLCARPISRRAVLRHELPHVGTRSGCQRGATAKNARAGPPLQHHQTQHPQPVEDLPGDLAAEVE